MARELLDNSIGQKDLEEHIAGSDDFLFEMEVLKSLHTNFGFGQPLIEHGGTYTDPATRKPRQFDLRLTAFAGQGLRLAFAIECKNVRSNFPLLVYEVLRGVSESTCTVIVRDTRLAKSYPLSIATYRKSPWVGRNCVQVGRAKKDGRVCASQDGVYDKWAQAISSSYGMMEWSARKLRADEEFVRHTIVFPVVVIPSQMLWAQRFASDGRPQGQPKPSNYVDYFVGREFTLNEQSIRATVSHLRICPIDHMDEAIQGLMDDACWAVNSASGSLPRLGAALSGIEL